MKLQKLVMCASEFVVNYFCRRMMDAKFLATITRQPAFYWNTRHVFFY